jgi:hypothetical protein
LKRLGFDQDVAVHLAHNYGDKAFDVSRVVGREKGLNKRLAAGYPFIEAEVVYAARHEYALTATDMIANRIRLAFLNSDASYYALPRVIALMGRELGWDTQRKIIEYQHAAHFLSTMNRKGVNPLAFSDPLKLPYTEARLREVFDSVPFGEHEIASLRASFNALDKDEDGHLSRADVLKLVHESHLFSLREAKLDLEKNGAGGPRGTEALNKPTGRFLKQLDLLDKDDSITFEPFLFSVAASFHGLQQQQQQRGEQKQQERQTTAPAPATAPAAPVAPASSGKQEAKQHDKLEKDATPSAAAVPAPVAPSAPAAAAPATGAVTASSEQASQPLGTTASEPKLGTTKKADQ